MFSNKKRIILDMDVGTDDAFAFLILLYAEKLNLVKIEAIICTMGNTTVDNVCTNVVRLLELFKRTDIPVFKGATTAIISSEAIPRRIHGNDGFGDLIYDSEPNLSIIHQTSAVQGMRDIVISNPKEISLVCIGPLMKIYQDFAPNLKEIFIMGGNYTGVGNATSTAEFNFYVDPESAYIVLETAKCPVTILPWETCLDSSITFEWRFDVLGVIDTPFMRLLNRAERKIFAHRPTNAIWKVADAFLAIPMIFPKETILRENKHHATVELQGNKTRGQLVLDHLKTKEPNATIIEKVNDEFVKKILLEAAQFANFAEQINGTQNFTML